MTSDACRELRPALGAVALGNADAAETLALRAHLDGCAECRAELRELTSVAAALSLADPAHLVAGLPLPPPGLAQEVLGRVAAERSARRRRTRNRYAGVGAAAVAIAAALVAFALIAPSGTPGTRVVFAAKSGVTADATLRSHDSGTQVAFHVSGLHQGDYYWLWLTGVDGDRVGAGTFRGTAGTAHLVMNAGLPLSEARRIWVTDAHDRVVLDQLLPTSA